MANAMVNAMANAMTNRGAPKGGAITAEEDMEFEFGKEKFSVRKGDYYCHGLWLDKLPRARN